MTKLARKLATLTLLALLGSASMPGRADAPDWLLGNWVLDSERTQAVQVKKRNSGSFGGLSGASVSVGGVAVPLPGGGSTAAASGSPRDPEVLRCSELNVSSEGENLRFTFVGVGDELVKPGNNQGRVTKWSRRKLTSNYETTSRKVSRTYELEKDGSLLVTIRIKPKQAAAIVQKRVFERPAD